MAGENKEGRPAMTPEEKAEKIKLMSQKLEPYLKSGLSIRKALAEAKISKTDFYRMMEEVDSFRDTINQFRQFVAVLSNNAIVRELMFIIDKQNGNEAKHVKPEKLSRDDREFLKWFVLSSTLTKDEFGERKDISLFDPEAEIQKVKGLLEDMTTKKISHGQSQ